MSARKYHSELRAQQTRDTRRRILVGASRVTAFDVTLLTHAAVARAAGVSERTVYRHFPTVKELHEAFSQSQEKRLGPYEEADFEIGDLPELFERWPQRIAGSGALEAMLARPEPEIFVKSRKRRYARIERALGRLLPDAKRKQLRQLTLVFGALMSAEVFVRGKRYLHLDPQDVVPGPMWAMRILIERLRRGDTPWK
jgi:AcrR family transcriptional regulator